MNLTRSERTLAWFLAAFLVAGQFFACYWTTDRLWPFNPIQIYTGPGNFKAASGSVIVAYRKEQEKNVVNLGWVDDYVAIKLSTRIAKAKSEDAVTYLKAVEEFLEPSERGYDGLRVYNLTYNLRTGELLKKDLLAEVQCTL